MSEIKKGATIIVRDAAGDYLRRRALSGVVAGHDFEVVWACREEEWEAASSEGRQPEATPWPADDVRVAEGAPA